MPRIRPACPSLLAELAPIFGFDPARPIFALTIREPKDGVITVAVEFPIEVPEIERFKSVVARYSIRPIQAPPGVRRGFVAGLEPLTIRLDDGTEVNPVAVARPYTTRLGWHGSVVNGNEWHPDA